MVESLNLYEYADCLRKIMNFFENVTKCANYGIKIENVTKCANYGPSLLIATDLILHILELIIDALCCNSLFFSGSIDKIFATHEIFLRVVFESSSRLLLVSSTASRIKIAFLRIQATRLKMIWTSLIRNVISQTSTI